MKTIRQLLLFSLLLSAFGLVCHAATHNVGAGESIQTAINGATSGDTIVLTAPADYDGNVTIAGKALRIISLHRNNHDVTGNISISAVPAGQSVTFKNLSVSGPVSAWARRPRGAWEGLTRAPAPQIS